MALPLATVQSVARALPNERLYNLPDGLTAETLRAAREGDPTAFAKLVHAYYPRCLRFARSFLNSPEDAEECVQDAFVRVHKAFRRYEDRERFNAWLFRILANRCRSARRRARQVLVNLAQLRRMTSTSTATRDPLSLGDDFCRGLAALPRDQREAFLLRHVEGFTYEEISAISGVSVMAVRMRVSRAGQCLRAAVTEGCA